MRVIDIYGLFAQWCSNLYFWITAELMEYCSCISSVVKVLKINGIQWCVLVLSFSIFSECIGDPLMVIITFNSAHLYFWDSDSLSWSFNYTDLLPINIISSKMFFLLFFVSTTYFSLLYFLSLNMFLCSTVNEMCLQICYLASTQHLIIFGTGVVFLFDYITMS